ncbi:hypothetical protein J2X65_001645 [Ancylobacter sp. 3268]|uniref:DUF6950 family protein n=1 Tax=Ancylobacter sp. 3268 TaxID=2817752 RepID=UPI00286752E4|nr:hypothetical protein [Ancylobacter sp. 3268]MDR6952290.1 hypothetical protein [Ancylobacter sp. 3268]
MLAGYLRELAQHPHVWGERDCILIAADWWRVNHGTDPAEGWRGTYSDEASCRARLAEHGGLLRVVRSGMRRVGARRTFEPRLGDVALVRAGHLLVGAIALGDGRWIGKSPDGVSRLRTHHVIAWSLG